LAYKEFLIPPPENSSIPSKLLWQSLKYAISFLLKDIVLIIYLQANDWGALSRLLLHPPFSPLELILSTETMAEHRAKSLSALLQIALATGFSETDPELEPLKVLQSF
jgi:hypothetical protein